MPLHTLPLDAMESLVHYRNEEVAQRSSDQRAVQPHLDGFAVDFGPGEETLPGGCILAEDFGWCAGKVSHKDFRYEIEYTWRLFFRQCAARDEVKGANLV